MMRFVYKATQLTGGAGAGMIEGRENAPDEHSLRERLRDRGYIALEVRTANPLDRLRSRARQTSFHLSDRVWFFRTLDRFLGGGAPLERALTTMVDLSPNERLRNACERIRSSVRNGNSLDESFGDVAGLSAPQHIALLRGICRHSAHSSN